MLKSILNNLTLKQEDREKLKTKRGFTDEVIDQMQFKSCGPELEKEEWFKAVPENYQAILSHKNIVIPYLDPDRNPIYLRAHKFGPAGEPVHVYVPWEYMDDNMEILAITEGEFKAIASCIMGVPCIGLPGVSSFSKTNYNRLAQLISQLEPKKIVICFDNEIKDNPNLPNYKADFRKRYDTQFFAYIMGHQLQSISKQNVSIATLPTKWINGSGKVDIDGILAKGIDPKEYHKVIMKDSLSPSQYKMQWKMPSIHASYLERKLDKFFYNGSLIEQFNCYFLKEGGGDNVRLKSISNFIIKVKYTLYDEDGKVQRLCKLYSKYGSSPMFTIQAETMTSKQTFQKFLWELGDYTYEAGDPELKSIWKYIFMNQDGRIVKLLHYHGYDETIGAWFFSNGAYYKDTFYPFDEDSIVWLDDVGYMIDSKMEDIDPPSLCSNSENSISLIEILNNLTKSLGKDHARLLLGWTLGNFFMPEIIKEWKIYPFLFLYGKQAGGKSTIANWISSFFGFTQKGINFHNSSVVGISRTASQMSMVPVWLEEYRNKDQDIGRKNNYLRGIYDRSTIVKGTKTANQVKTYTARSTLILSGEEYPRDAALNSRCIMFSIFRSSDQQKVSQEFLWLEKYKSMFNYIGHYILTNKKDLWPKVKHRINDYIQSFDSENVDVATRNKLQMSIVSGVIDILIGEDHEFSFFVAQKAEDMERVVTEEQALNIFFEDIYNMHHVGKFKNKVFDFRYIKGKKIMVMNFTGAYAEWEIYYKGLRNDIPASKAALMDHIQRESYLMECKPTSLDGKTMRCFVFDTDDPNFPYIFKMLDEDMAESEKQKIEEEEDGDGK